ncbi:MAG: cytochrome P450 [Bacteroidota bacterium]
MDRLPTIPRLEVLKNRKEILKNPLPFHQKYFRKYGDTFRIDLGGKNNWVFTRNPWAVRHILQKNHKNYHKSALQTRDLAKYVGHGLLTTNGEPWRVHRRIIQPAFHKEKLEGLLDIMHSTITTELGGIVPNEVQDIFPLMGDLAFQVVAQSLFSTDDIRERMQRLKQITEENQKMLIKEMRLPYLKWWFQWSGEIKRHLRLSEEARELLNGIVQERVNLDKERDDLLYMLITARYEDGTPMSRRQLLDEVMILFTAGHETTANALSFALWLLALHPKMQKRLYMEVRGIDFNKGDIMPVLGQLSFTRQCVEEAMRLYPPAYFMDRVSLDEDVIGDHTFKKGTIWLMSLYELHRHPHFWERPNEFIPQRFDLKNKKDFSDYYFPFGAGPRMCVGNNFALYEMMMVLALVVQKYELASIAEIQVNPLITLKPRSAMLTFTERD